MVLLTPDTCGRALAEMLHCGRGSLSQLSYGRLRLFGSVRSSPRTPRLQFSAPLKVSYLPPLVGRYVAHCSARALAYPSSSKEAELSYRDRSLLLRYGARFRHSVSYAQEEEDEESSEEEGGKNKVQVSTLSNVDEWRTRLIAFLRNPNKEEILSMEKKDRRDYKRLSELAKQFGLHSQMYGKVVAFSKVPLANYRAELDQKRPVRKVSISPAIHRDVDRLLGQHLDANSINGNEIKAHLNGTVGVAANLSPERFPVSPHILQIRSKSLQEKQQAWRDSPDGQKMMTLRANLPAYKQRESLLLAISNNQVLVVSGETGCGKTTQLPQYILESEIEAGRGGSCSIICTQPRRISAMAVSERVAAERGEPLGESVGYKVRLEGTRGRDTRLLFCTTGILLRRLLVDPMLTGVTHVIVDEIHERGMNEDFLLIVLKDILPRRPDLRLILMSATLNAELFSKYFDSAPTSHIPGFTYPVRSHFLEDILELTGHRLTEFNQIDDYGHGKSWKMHKQINNRKRKTTLNSLVENALVDASFDRCSYETRFSLSRWDPESLGFSLVEALLYHICTKERPGAVLVFMTGWEDINALKEKLMSHSLMGDKRRVLVLACHGGMASAEQRLIFDHPPPNVRKIVLATNMAETSITINDVVFVVDCGKAKETSYDALNNTPCLLPTWISKASARQRRGRAGRVHPGEAYHIYPKAVFDAFAEYQLPELHRVPLHSLCLQIKSLNLGSIEEFLSKAMQPPEPLSVRNSIHLLKTIGALDDNEELTHLGRHLSMLPMEPTVGKMLVMGSILGCLEPVLTIAAGLSLKDPFVSPIDKRDMADQRRFEFGVRDCSDHMAYVHAYDGWLDAKKEGTALDYCWNNFLSPQTLEAIHSLRRQFKDLIRESGFLNGTANENNDHNRFELLGGVICSGLYPRVAAVLAKSKTMHFKTVEDGEVLLNQNSVLSKMKTIPRPWLVFNEKVKTGTVIIRDSTAISDTMLLLFGGKLSLVHKRGHLVMPDGGLEFHMSKDLSETILMMRKELDGLLSRKLENPKLDIYEDGKYLLGAISTLMNGDQNLGSFVSVNSVSVSSPKVPDISVTVKLRDSNNNNNSVSVLHNWFQQTGQEVPKYTVKGPKNNLFQARVKCQGQYFIGKPATNKRQAERNAATEALDWLHKAGSNC